MRPLAAATHQRTRACRLRTNEDVAKKRPQTLAIQRFRHSDLTRKKLPTASPYASLSARALIVTGGH